NHSEGRSRYRQLGGNLGPITQATDERSRGKFIRHDNLVTREQTQAIELCSREYPIHAIRRDDHSVCTEHKSVMQVRLRFPFTGHLQVSPGAGARLKDK